MGAKSARASHSRAQPANATKNSHGDPAGTDLAVIEGMTLTGNPLQIVVGYDFSPAADRALDQAIRLANTEAPAVVHVLGVLGGRGGAALAHPPHKKFGYRDADREQQRLEDVVVSRAGATSDDIRIFVHARIGAPATEILGLAEEVGAAAIFVGTHGRNGLARLALGSVAEEVVRKARCGVTVARPSEYRRPAQTPNVPEPPCPHCIARRDETGGAEWWCEPHKQPWVPPRRYAPTRGKLVPVRDKAWVLW